MHLQARIKALTARLGRETSATTDDDGQTIQQEDKYPNFAVRDMLFDH
jgi:hypothetical protein